jgi:hypothetical protein
MVKQIIQKLDLGIQKLARIIWPPEAPRNNCIQQQ